MAKNKSGRPKAYKGPTLASLQGRPVSTPSKAGVKSFGGAPTIASALNRGGKQSGRSGGSSKAQAFKGGKTIRKIKGAKPSKGGGANVGGGAVS